MLTLTEAQLAALQAEEDKPLLAWEVEIDCMHAICFAASAAKARWIAVKNYREAGFGREGVWPRPKAWRSERHDKSVLKDRGPKCWTPSYAEEMR